MKRYDGKYVRRGGRPCGVECMKYRGQVIYFFVLRSHVAVGEDPVKHDLLIRQVTTISQIRFYLNDSRAYGLE